MAAKVAPSAKVARQPVVGSSYPLTTSFTASLTLHLPPMFRPSRYSITLLGSRDSQLQFFRQSTWFACGLLGVSIRGACGLGGPILKKKPRNLCLFYTFIIAKN